LDKDPQGSNTAFYACKNNCSSGSIVEISSNMNVDDKRIKYEVKKDCYFGPHYQRQNDFTCATCYEKNNSPNLPSPSNPNQPNNPSPNNNSNPTIPNSVQEYFQANNVKKIELENNK
ncbi:32154_t:CDS:1, partial [Racocetra persica]